MVTPDEVRQIAREETRKSNVDSLLSGVIASSGIDGVVTWYDIAAAVLIAFAFSLLAIFVTLGVWIVAGIDHAPTWGGRTILTGAILGCLRLLTDAIDPLGMISE